MPAETAATALDEWAEAIVPKNSNTTENENIKNRRGYLVGVLKRIHRETDATVPLSQRRGFDRKGHQRGRGNGAARVHTRK